jgi:hypothetical protein
MQSSHPMFVLGQVARCIWRDGDIPQATLALMFMRPLSSLEAVMAAPEAKTADQCELIRLLNMLRFDPPVGPASLWHQSTFWIGWHEYATSKPEVREVPRTLLPLRSAA